MTSFMRDLTGNDIWWKKDAMRAIMKMRKTYLNGKIIIEEDGAVKWKLSGNYLPEECAEMLMYALYEHKDPVISLEATKSKREAQNKESLKAYRESRKNHVLTDEERYEMEAAFGKGAQVVDAITGQVFQL